MKLRNWILSIILAGIATWFIYAFGERTNGIPVFIILVLPIFIIIANMVMELFIEDFLRVENQLPTKPKITQKMLLKNVGMISDLVNNLIIHDSCDDEVKEVQKLLKELSKTISDCEIS